MTTVRITNPGGLTVYDGRTDPPTTTTYPEGAVVSFDLDDYATALIRAEQATLEVAVGDPGDPLQSTGG
jgi:hypothetical protein